MNLAEVNIALNHSISGSDQYLWNCFGPNALYLDYSNKYGEASVIFDTITKKVYQVSLWFLDDRRPYRWIDPEYKNAFIDECKKRNIDFTIAYDETKCIDLEVESDLLEKANSLFSGKKVDDRVLVPLELDNDTLLHLAMEAHKRDVTLNTMVDILLRQMVEEETK